MTPVEARKISSGWQPAALAAILRGELRSRSRPFLPVKALALPELTTSARALPPASCRAAPVDRRRRAFRAGEDAGDRRARVEQREQHVGAALVADAGLGGREAHAGDRRQLGNASARAARRGGHGHEPAATRG